MVQIVMFLLVETIDVGGGTIAMIESLASFNNLTSEVDKEKKMSVRPYVMMPYLAAILLGRNNHDDAELHYWLWRNNNNGRFSTS